MGLYTKFLMNITIKFNAQIQFITIEVKDVRTYRMLSAETEAHLPLSQILP